MKDTEYTSGGDIRRITNRAFIRLDTPHASRIVFGLDKSGVPYFARFTGTHISLTYDASKKASADEVIKKVMSGDYDEIIRTVKESKPDVGCLALLPEVASLLNTSIGTLRSRPIEIQEQLCKAYADLWVCDTPTLQRELSGIITVNARTEQDMEKHKHHKEAR